MDDDPSRTTMLNLWAVIYKDGNPEVRKMGTTSLDAQDDFAIVQTTFIGMDDERYKTLNMDKRLTDFLAKMNV